MKGLNLHDIVRPAITFVHPDEDCLLYQSNGQVNRLGEIKAVYLQAQEVRINFQPLDADTLRHLEQLNDTSADEQVFLYSDPDSPVAGQQRVPILRTGDFIYRTLDKTWYLVTSVIQDWSKRGWANAGVTLQVTEPDFSACEWYPMPLKG